MTILEDILRQKKKEVEQLKKQPIVETPSANKPVQTVVHTFHNTDRMNIIAEIKRASPSKGSIDMEADPAEQAILYEACGAGAISVLTDEAFFKGSLDDLRAVRNAVDIPILCKDFVIDKVQIDHAKSAGASIILLIVAAMNPSKLSELYTYATRQGLEVLCEVHNEPEMETAIDLGADMIGINNRNLKTFDVTLSTTERLASMVVNPETILISESGIKTRDDVMETAKSGASGILVGETLMRSNNLQELFNELKIPLSEGGRSHAR
ncbi:indole-3-glycerol phosphate synthase [Lentibacillus halodurans]|uniref:Indole-3-glycerol phosphate synthase n=1 Tax=Lentibacillus halodurans TaxID=237679 RepID=A0A1I0XY97_9BACI|nr:indole-3-glycerol phosphate synthase TrpC [Lentibacillus halodurans]SFB05647.1 indole-3-glycerol phosphate synthase [Lentibacillus halodurans]